VTGSPSSLRPHGRANGDGSSLQRFAGKTGFERPWRQLTALTMKIFSLPKTATQSPRRRLSVHRRDSRFHHQRIALVMRELKKVLQRSRFLQT
jgi:hypothetical protein